MVQECVAESSVPCLGQVIDSWIESGSRLVSQSLGSWGRKFSICSGLHHRIHSSFLPPTLIAPLPPVISQQDLSYRFNNPCWEGVRQEGGKLSGDKRFFLGIEGVGLVVTLPLPPALCNSPNLLHIDDSIRQQMAKPTRVVLTQAKTQNKRRTQFKLSSVYLSIHKLPLCTV